MDDAPFTEDLDLDGATTREDLAQVLRQLQILADRPSLRDMERWAFKQGRTLAKSTVADMLSGKRLPTRAALLTFLEACGVPADQLAPWKKAWGRIALAEDGRPSLATEVAELRQRAEQEGRAAILAEAQTRAQELVDQAGKDAVVLIKDAEARCETLRQQTLEQCQGMVRQAEKDAAVLLEAAAAQRRETDDQHQQAQVRSQELIRRAEKAEKDAAARLALAGAKAEMTERQIAEELAKAIAEGKRMVAGAIEQVRQTVLPASSVPLTHAWGGTGGPLPHSLYNGEHAPVRALWDTYFNEDKCWHYRVDEEGDVLNEQGDRIDRVVPGDIFVLNTSDTHLPRQYGYYGLIKNRGIVGYVMQKKLTRTSP